MSSAWLWAGALIVAAAGVSTTLYLQSLRERNPGLAVIEPAHVDPITDLPVVEPVPVVAAPLPEEPSAQREPLPELDSSDAEFLGWAGELIGSANVERFFVPERVIRKIVVTIDNLPRRLVSLDQRPIVRTPGAFATTGSEDEPFLAPENTARYEPFMALVRNTDAATAVGLYRRFEPLFQEAYEDLGYPGRSFRERLVEVIDHLLGAPDVRGPIPLTQPRVMYEYADPNLEAESAGRKTLVRMGPEHAALIKAKLREIESLLERR